MTGNVLVTGCEGFTGRYLAAELARAGYTVHGLARSRPALDNPDVAVWHTADLLDAAALAAVVRAAAPRHVVHLAAIAFVGHGDAEAFYRVNTVGTRHLLEALTGLAAPPQAVLIASSANVYGNQERSPIAEGAPLLPANDYAVSKVAAEYVARLYHDRLPLVIARPFNYTGSGQPLQFVVPKIVDHARRRAPVVELGNLEVARDFSDVRRVVAIYRQLLETPAALGQTVNVCSGEPVSLHRILQLVSDAAGYPLHARINPAFVRRNDVLQLAGDATLLHRLLPDLPPAVPLPATLRWMLARP